MGQDSDKNDQPIQFRIHNVELGLKGGVDVQEYEEPLLGARVLQMDYRAANERLTKIAAVDKRFCLAHLRKFRHAHIQWSW